ncbi:hypothetical protein E1200_24395 [Actinomadura sp. GC306]|uniref:SecDF P1 head subdomain-containing protein n=1 Tax=Actinomadura sp. GC306 TaxID=2530367 RepID=UPI0010510143|nr:hypothetical protein [Actinomadura sp. GC306]TDC62824.1 hypothetical protein E1200_24395 [Actinomadura sp. GC306]
MRVIPRRSRNRRQDEDPARDPSSEESSAKPPEGAAEEASGGSGTGDSPAVPDPAPQWPPSPAPDDAATRPLDTAGAQPARGEQATAVLPAVPEAGADAGTEAARRRARAAERQRMAAEVKRSRAARRGRPQKELPSAARAADQHRSAMLVMVLTLGLLIAAVAVTGALIASSMRTQPVTLAAPLHIYPVTQTTQGQCPAGTQGITGQSGTGPTCYGLAQGIAIRKVADLRVQKSRVQPGGHDVALTLRPADRKAFADLTRATVGRDLAFVVRNRIVTLPRVDMAILDGKVVVTGPQDRASANRLVRELKGRR